MWLYRGHLINSQAYAETQAVVRSAAVRRERQSRGQAGRGDRGRGRDRDRAEGAAVTREVIMVKSGHIEVSIRLCKFIIVRSGHGKVNIRLCIVIMVRSG